MKAISWRFKSAFGLPKVLPAPKNPQKQMVLRIFLCFSLLFRLADASERCFALWLLFTKICIPYRNSGLFPLFDGSAQACFSNVNTDRLHPGNEGHRIIARTILNAL